MENIMAFFHSKNFELSSNNLKRIGLKTLKRSLNILALIPSPKRHKKIYLLIIVKKYYPKKQHKIGEIRLLALYLDQDLNIRNLLEILNMMNVLKKEIDY